MRNEGYEASLDRNKLYVVLSDPEAEREGTSGSRTRAASTNLYPAEWFVALEVPKAMGDSLLKAF